MTSLKEILKVIANLILFAVILLFMGLTLVVEFIADILNFFVELIRKAYARY